MTKDTKPMIVRQSLVTFWGAGIENVNRKFIQA
jgi:hypothetical protein